MHLQKRIALVLILLMLSACSTRQLILQGVASELATQGQAPEDDLVLAREAGAFYLKLSESVLSAGPGHLPLAEAVSSGFTQYAYAFVANEADQVESRDVRAAQRLRERAARLYTRAHRHAMTALESHRPGFARALADPDPTRWPVLSTPELALAYWAAASWGGAIALSKDRPEVVADLPLAIRLASLAYRADPRHGEGALASLMGSFEMARPGGSVQQAGAYFDQAIALGKGKNAGVFVARAEAMAQPAGNRVAFAALLRQALDAAAARPDLPNTVMRERAQWLLDTIDDLF